jgi:hypothetical protein
MSSMTAGSKRGEGRVDGVGGEGQRAGKLAHLSAS